MAQQRFDLGTCEGGCHAELSNGRESAAVVSALPSSREETRRDEAGPDQIAETLPSLSLLLRPKWRSVCLRETLVSTGGSMACVRRTPLPRSFASVQLCPAPALLVVRQHVRRSAPMKTVTLVTSSSLWSWKRMGAGFNRLWIPFVCVLVRLWGAPPGRGYWLFLP